MRVMVDTNVIISAILILENKLFKDTDNQSDLNIFSSYKQISKKE